MEGLLLAFLSLLFSLVVCETLSSNSIAYLSLLYRFVQRKKLRNRDLTDESRTAVPPAFFLGTIFVRSSLLCHNAFSSPPKMVQQLLKPAARALSTGVRASSLATHAAPASNNFVTILECGARDGLQNEKQTISTELKAEFITKLVGAGLKFIEGGAFVSPKWVSVLFRIPSRKKRLSSSVSVIGATNGRHLQIATSPPPWPRI